MAFYLSAGERLVAAAGMASVLVLGGLRRAGRAIHVGRRTGALPVTGVTAMPAVCAMRTVHEQVAADEEGEQGVVPDGAQRDVEDKDRRQRDNEAQAQKPDHGRDAHGTISCRGIVFHLSLSLKSKCGFKMTLDGFGEKCERCLACLGIRRLAGG